MGIVWGIIKITVGLFFAVAVLAVFALAIAAGRADELMGYDRRRNQDEEKDD